MKKLFFAILLITFNKLTLATEIPVIAAAASVKFALQDIVKEFTKDTDKKIRISYSSSGNLTRQILQGGPFEIFLSANTHYIDQLHQQHKTLGQGVVYAVGRLVLLTHKDSKIQLDENLAGLRQALLDGRLQRFAIANPVHAPYGVAGKDVLHSMDLWTLSAPNLVLGENIAQAAQFISSGAAQVGLISYSLALAPALQNRTRFLLLPADLHQPLQQSMVLLSNAGETSKLFFNYLQQEKARNILLAYGYSAP